MTSKPLILVVEDEYLVALDIEDMLVSAGYTVVGPAASLGEAYGLLERAPPAAALLDANLDGQSVEGLADVLAARGIPFLFVSGYGVQSLPARFRDRVIMAKPFHRTELLMALAGLVST